MLSVQRSSDSVSVGATVGRCRNSVSASRYTVGVDVAADGVAGDPQQPGGRPHREPLQLRLLDRLPAGDRGVGARSCLFAVSGVVVAPLLATSTAAVAAGSAGSRRGAPPEPSPEAMRSWSGFRASSERAALSTLARGGAPPPRSSTTSSRTSSPTCVCAVTGPGTGRLSPRPFPTNGSGASGFERSGRCSECKCLARTRCRALFGGFKGTLVELRGATAHTVFGDYRKVLRDPACRARRRNGPHLREPPRKVALDEGAHAPRIAWSGPLLASPRPPRQWERCSAVTEATDDSGYGGELAPRERSASAKSSWGGSGNVSLKRSSAV